MRRAGGICENLRGFWESRVSAEVRPPKGRVPFSLGHGRRCHALSRFRGALRLMSDSGHLSA